jgi:hypothetical protein
MAPKGFTRVSLDYHHSSPHRSVRCLPKIRAMTSILKRVWHLRNCSRKRACVFVALAALSLMVASPAAFAHVKWFCNYNVAEQPVLLPQVISGGFGQLVALALLFLLALAIIGSSPIGSAFQLAIDWVTGPIQASTETLLRATYGAFFVALWAKGGIILTPELKTTAAWIAWLQLSIAAGMLWQSTLAFSGLGIIVLFGKALVEYGIFHLMDYPLFLGAAAYFILMGTRRPFFRIRPLDVVRYAAAVTLMWASIEKWAYPQWTYPLFLSHPQISFGFDVAFYMKAAGVVEFSLAFALCWTPLARRAAAFALSAMFVSAIFEFGKIDAIGHAPIIVVLIAIAADEARAPRRHPALAPAWYVVAIGGFTAAYYIMHSSLFGTAII